MLKTFYSCTDKRFKYFYCICAVYLRKVLKEISVGDIKPDETVDAVKEARLLAKVGMFVAWWSNYTIYTQLDNPFIVKFHDSFLEDEKFCIITKYCKV